MQWDEVRWNEMRQDVMRWDEMQWGEMRRDESAGPILSRQLVLSDRDSVS